MVQSVSGTGLGFINKVGTSPEGRVIYEVNDPQGQMNGRISVAANDSDTFEKAFNDIIDAAPKIQKYMETTPPEKMEKKQKTAKWITTGGGILGAAIPLFTMKPKGFGKGLLAFGVTLAAGVAGLLTGSLIARKTCTPPGAEQFTKATQTLQKLDIKAA